MAIITEIKSYRVRKFEIQADTQKYYLNVMLNDTNQIVEAHLQNPLIRNLDDLNVLKEIIIKLETYNWE